MSRTANPHHLWRLASFEDSWNLPLIIMRVSIRLVVSLALLFLPGTLVAAPKLPSVGPAMQEMIAKNEIAGAVTVVVTKDKIVHLQANGWADAAAKKPMKADTVFWVASMTKP